LIVQSLCPYGGLDRRILTMFSHKSMGLLADRVVGGHPNMYPLQTLRNRSPRVRNLPSGSLSGFDLLVSPGFAVRSPLSDAANNPMLAKVVGTVGALCNVL
jgi:hypothetical protein